MNNAVKRSFKMVAILFSVVLIAACGGNTEEKTEMNETNEMQTTQQAESGEAMQGDESDENMNQNVTVDGKLNVNTATGEAFRSIPKVGDKMVHEFEEYRPYTSIQQFRREIGKYVDEDQVAEYEKAIYVPVHRNNSDAATMMQVPGLDQSEVEKLIEGRPYDSNQAFTDALADYLSEEEMKTAKIYLKAQ